MSAFAPVGIDLQRLVQDMIDKRLVHEVHTSERKSFRGCRRRWHWVFQEFYYPRTTAKPLEFGIAFHNAMEVLYNPDTWTWDRTVVKNTAIQTFVDTCEAQKKKFLSEANEQYLTNEEVEEDYNERVELGKGMLNYYVNDVASKSDAGWKPLKVEVEFIVPIQNPDTGEYLFCKCLRCMRTIENWKNEKIQRIENADGSVSPEEDLTEILRLHEVLTEQGLPVCLAGRIDLLAQDPNGNYWIVDWKTAARLSRGESTGDRDEFLELDDQIGSYVMALRRKLKIDVKGFVYVELKKAFPQQPQRNKQARLGRMYSVNQSQACDYDTYLETIKREDTAAFEAGLYDDFLEFLQNDGIKFHGRYQIAKMDEELEEIERNLFYEASEMTNPNLVIYPSAGRFNCGFCAFRQPCLEKNRQGDYQYMLDTLYDRRKSHYWVKELSTDKQGAE